MSPDATLPCDTTCPLTPHYPVTPHSNVTELGRDLVHPASSHIVASAAALASPALLTPCGKTQNDTDKSYVRFRFSASCAKGVDRLGAHCPSITSIPALPRVRGTRLRNVSSGRNSSSECVFGGGIRLKGEIRLREFVFGMCLRGFGHPDGPRPSPGQCVFGMWIQPLYIYICILGKLEKND